MLKIFYNGGRKGRREEGGKGQEQRRSGGTQSGSQNQGPRPAGGTPATTVPESQHWPEHSCHPLPEQSLYGPHVFVSPPPNSVQAHPRLRTSL